jgi:hypothetical protein
VLSRRRRRHTRCPTPPLPNAPALTLFSPSKSHTTAPSRKLLNGNANVAVAAPGPTNVQVTPRNVAVSAPGTRVAVDTKTGTAAAKGPGNTQVLATKDAVAVNAPAGNTRVAVDKRTGDVAVAAPGTTVVANRQAGVAAVRAPGTDVIATPQGTAVSAPFTTVLTGAAAAGTGCRTVVRVPIIGLNFCGDGRRLF